MKSISKTSGFYLLAAVFPFVIYAFSNQFSFESLKAAARAPWLCMVLLGFLGWRLNQTRILLTACVLALLFWLLLIPGQAVDTLNIMSLSLPASLAILFIPREAPLLSQRTLIRLIVAALPWGLFYVLSQVDPSAFAQTLQWKLASLNVIALPQASLAGPLILAGLAAFSRDLKVKHFLQALAFSLLPLMLAIDKSLSQAAAKAAENDPRLILALLCSCAILLWAIFNMYWHRVYLDELTGIPNRRALDEKLASLDTGYSLAMVDIDHFKKFNDSYGHEEGDNVLKLVARHLKDGSGDRAYRYGGEEFCLVFEDWGSEVAAGHADGIRETLAKRDFSIRLPGKIRKKTSAEDRGSMKGKSVNVHVTISIGVARPDEKHAEASEVIKLADQGLYDAKEKGRNCVVRKN